MEKLIKYQANSSCVIMSLILMTTLFDKALILQGEIWYWSLLVRAKGLKSIFKVKSEKQKSKVDLRTRVYLHETGTNTSYFRTGLRPSDRFLIIACLVRICLHTFLFMRLHGTGPKMNSKLIIFWSTGISARESTFDFWFSLFKLKTKRTIAWKVLATLKWLDST